MKFIFEALVLVIVVNRTKNSAMEQNDWLFSKKVIFDKTLLVCCFEGFLP